MRRGIWMLAVAALVACGGDRSGDASQGTEMAITGPTTNRFVELWSEGQPAFGLYAPNEREDPRQRGPDGRPLPAVYTVAGAESLGANPLLDFVFLNLEGSYDPAAVDVMVEGLHAGAMEHRPALLVRIPSIESAGEETTRRRIAEIVEPGADGVTVPHVRSVEEARLVIGFFEESGADVWSPSNPGGSFIGMMMVEDRAAVAAAAEIAALPGYSLLACGIGSYTADLGGDREAAEAGNLQVLAEAEANGLADMITANAQDIARRVEEGFLGLLMQGPTANAADETILIGRAAAGRTDG